LLWGIGYTDNFGSITTAGQGKQFVTMGGGSDANRGGVLGTGSWSQTITGFTPQLPYTLSFMMASELVGVSQSIDVSFPSGSLTPGQTFTAAAPSANYWRDWEIKSMNFIPTATSVTFQFQATTQFDVGLDNVQITTCVPPPPGLVAWYPGDGNANDIQGGNNGTLENGTTFAAGKVDQAFHFDRTKDQFVQTTNASNLNFDRTNSFSMDAWIHTSETVHDIFIATKQQNSAPYDGYGLVITNGEVPACDAMNPTAPGAGQLAGFLDGAVSNTCPPDNYIAVRGTTHLNDGQWHHVAMTYDGSSSASGLKLYVDGVPEASVVQEDTLGTHSILNNVPFTIGSRENGGVPFNGDIDEVEVFNRAIEGSEVAAIFDAGSAGKCKPSNLLNISTRLNVQTGDNVLIGGFIITGSATEEVFLRGIGPSLPLVGSLPNPKLELHDSTGALLASNDDWMNSPQKDEIISKGLAPNNALESAVLADLAPGSYTTILSDANGGTGIGLVELYATDPSAPANPVNISTRGLVQTGDNVMIGGFILGGTQSRHLLLRAIGPSLGAAGVANPLLDPTLELHDTDGALISSNDDWRDTQEAEIAATGIPPNDDRESAIVMDLAPANYTAIVRGVNGTNGVALVEAYDIP